MSQSTEYLDSIDQLNNYDKIVLIFTADWCSPCQLISPHIFEISQDSNCKNIKFFKVNVDNHPELSNKYDIRNIPTFILIKSDNNLAFRNRPNLGIFDRASEPHENDLHIIDRIVGTDIKELVDKLNKHFIIKNSNISNTINQNNSNNIQSSDNQSELDNYYNTQNSNDNRFSGNC